MGGYAEVRRDGSWRKETAITARDGARRMRTIFPEKGICSRTGKRSKGCKVDSNKSPCATLI
jgi:hypothetical protein